MKILVTGGAGFVGSHVAEYYAKKNLEVVVFDNLSRAELLDYNSNNANYNWNYLQSNYDTIDFIKGDIRDANAIKNASKDCDVIIHTAAQVAVTSSMQNPRTDFEINALGTFKVFPEACEAKSNPVVVFCSTNKVYFGKTNWQKKSN